MKIFVNTQSHDSLISEYTQYIEGNSKEVYSKVSAMDIDPNEPIAIFLDNQFINCDELDLHQKINAFDAYWFVKTIKSISQMEWITKSYITQSGSIVTYKKDLDAVIRGEWDGIRLVSVSPVRLILGYDTDSLMKIFKENTDPIKMIAAVESYLTQAKESNRQVMHEK